MASLFNKSAFVFRQGARLVQSRTYADVAMKLTLAGANKVFYDAAEVRQIDVPSYSGDFGILATHVPTLGKRYCLLLYIRKMDVRKLPDNSTEGFRIS